MALPIGLLTPEGEWQQYRPTTSTLRVLAPELRLGRVLKPRDFDPYDRLVLYKPTTPPQPEGFWQIIEEAPAIKVDGEWVQQWSATDAPLSEVKSKLAQMAASLAKRRFERDWTPAELQAASLSPIALLQARSTRIQTQLNGVVEQIQAASTIREAYAVYRTLRNAGA